MNPNWLLLHIVDALRVPSPPPHPADSYCSDALALGLGVVAVVLAAAAFIWAVLP